MFCGLCVEPCPTGSIQHTREFEATQRSVRNLVFRWADPVKPFPVYKVVKGAPYIPRAPLGSLVREVVARRRWDAPALNYLPPEPLKPPPPPPPKPPPAAKPAAPAAAKPAAAAPAAAAPAPAAPLAPAAAAAPAPAVAPAPAAKPDDSKP
jgi:NADH-quinone oxidoreductase subunit I/NAD(P)H-quinone oxidoreductase subunit I